MRGTTRIKVKIEVDVEVGFEFDPIFRQASITSAKISDRNPLTPRAVYASMVSGDYASMDSSAKIALKASFLDGVQPYLNSATKDLPEEGIRSCPLTPAEWASMMKPIRNAHLPIAQIEQAVGRLRLMVEPVLCSTPTLYLWPTDPSEPQDITRVKEQMHVVRASNIEAKEDGSIKVTWKYPR